MNIPTTQTLPTALTAWTSARGVSSSCRLLSGWFGQRVLQYIPLRCKTRGFWCVAGVDLECGKVLRRFSVQGMGNVTLVPW